MDINTSLNMAALPWKDQNDLPEDRFVLCLIAHYSHSPRNDITPRSDIPPKLVYAKADTDGIRLASGDELNFDWHVEGWLDHDIEFDISG